MTALHETKWYDAIKIEKILEGFKASSAVTVELDWCVAHPQEGSITAY